MKISVLGTGAMACLFAGRMAQVGHEVWMVSRWKENVEKIGRDGLRLMERGRPDLVAHPRATLHPEDVTADGVRPELVLVSCKTWQTEETVKYSLGIVGENTCVLSLQNGMGNEEILSRYVKADNVFFGAASVAAEIPEPGTVQDFTNRNRSPLISLMPMNRVMDKRTARIGELFQSLGYDTDASPAAERWIWRKLCINCCANAVSAVAQISNRLLANDRDGFILLSRITGEVCAVANAKSVPEDYEDLRAYIHFTLYNNGHYTSMCRDVHDRRPTEIDAINGAVVREGKRLGIPTPVNETLTHLVRLIENHYGEQLGKIGVS